MTVIFSETDAARLADGGTRVLILGAGTYPLAQAGAARVPILEDISSATKSAVDFADRVLGGWRERFERPLASVDLLLNGPGSPDGETYRPPGREAVTVDPPTLANIKAAVRNRWLKGAGPKDVLVFYCCGHGIWLPSTGRTFLASDFGDEEDPWPQAVALSDFGFALGEKAPRSQWLILDCCANAPTEALKAIAPRPDKLLGADTGGRAATVASHGPLSQATLFSSSVEAKAFGKAKRASRFMEALIEACEGSAYVAQDSQGRWWADRQGLENAISTYGRRVAKTAERDYFTFPIVSETDAQDIPRLLFRDGEPTCTLVARSEPADRLLAAQLTVTSPPSPEVIGSQAPGLAAQARYRQPVPAYTMCKVEAAFPDGPKVIQRLALPPLLETIF
jgi:hypothetical protein